MASITTRGTKGTPLTWNEVDTNFTNLNTELGLKYNSTFSFGSGYQDYLPKFGLSGQGLAQSSLVSTTTGVGISVSSPSFRLHVDGGSNLTTAYVSSSSTSVPNVIASFDYGSTTSNIPALVRFSDATSTSKWYAGSSGGISSATYGASFVIGNAISGGGYNERLRLSSVGDLSVDGNISTSNDISSNTGTITTVTTTTINATNSIIVSSNSLASGGTAYLSLKDTAVKGYIGFYSGDGSLGINNKNSAPVRIYTNDTERVQIDNNGNVITNGTGSSSAISGSPSGQLISNPHMIVNSKTAGKATSYLRAVYGVGNTTSPNITQYTLIAKLPGSDSSQFDNLRLAVTINTGWGATNTSTYDISMGNRGGSFYYYWTVSGSGVIPDKSGIQVIRQGTVGTDSSSPEAWVYAYVSGSTYDYITVDVLNASNITSIPIYAENWTTTAPTVPTGGSAVFNTAQPALYPPMFNSRTASGLGSILPLKATVNNSGSSSSTLDITLGPCQISFISPLTGTTSYPIVAYNTGELTLSVPHGGHIGRNPYVSSSSTADAYTMYTIVALLYNSTIELGICNSLFVASIAEGYGSLASTTILDNNSTSNSAVYSNTARTGSIPYRVIGTIHALNKSRGLGLGDAWYSVGRVAPLGLMSPALGKSLGYGQTWTSYDSTQRASGVSYYNTTDEPMVVSVVFNQTSTNTNMTLTIGGVVVAKSGQYNVVGGSQLTGIVPPNTSYMLSLGTNGFYSWAEFA